MVREASGDVRTVRVRGELLLRAHLAEEDGLAHAGHRALVGLDLHHRPALSSRYRPPPEEDLTAAARLRGLNELPDGGQAVHLSLRSMPVIGGTGLIIAIP
ncbi:hypothetical protein AB0D54_33230 [Streptomyces xanthophaeus]|uniref:hypothetical protein n=1 Tax=Streptomyces xanthophaeus TaxID=67385 RepID=UPI0034371978